MNTANNITKAIIIPAYNEEKRLDGEAFLAYAKANPSAGLLFVNDGSSDNTIGRLKQLEERAQGNIMVLDLKVNSGKAEAVRQGVQFLLSHTQAHYIGFMDADLSTDFIDMDRLFDISRLEMPETNMVFGSRKSTKENTIKKKGSRKLISKVINKFIRGIIQLEIEDTQCGAKVFTRSMAQSLFREGFLSKWLFDVELFLRVKSKMGDQYVHNHISEVPLLRWVHQEDSRISAKDSLMIPMELQRINQKYNWNTKVQSTKRTVKDVLSELFGLQHVRALEILGTEGI